MSIPQFTPDPHTTASDAGWTKEVQQAVLYALEVAENSIGISVANTRGKMSSGLYGHLIIVRDALALARGEMP